MPKNAFNIYVHIPKVQVYVLKMKFHIHAHIMLHICNSYNYFEKQEI